LVSKKRLLALCSIVGMPAAIDAAGPSRMVPQNAGLE